MGRDGPGRAGTASQNLATGRYGPGQPLKIWEGTQDGTITIFLSKSGEGEGNCYFLLF